MQCLRERIRFAVIEWLADDALIVAPDAQAAEAEARGLWFSFHDSGIDGVQVEEISS